MTNPFAEKADDLEKLRVQWDNLKEARDWMERFYDPEKMRASFNRNVGCKFEPQGYKTAMDCVTKLAGFPSKEDVLAQIDGTMTALEAWA